MGFYDRQRSKAQRKLARFLQPGEQILEVDAVQVHTPAWGDARAWVSTHALHLDARSQRRTLVTITLSEIVAADMGPNSISLRTRTGNEFYITSRPAIREEFVAALASGLEARRLSDEEP